VAYMDIENESQEVKRTVVYASLVLVGLGVP
jgi:hypothetical protein